jgi:hypothetical protein
MVGTLKGQGNVMNMSRKYENAQGAGGTILNFHTKNDFPRHNVTRTHPAWLAVGGYV